MKLTKREFIAGTAGLGMTTLAGPAFAMKRAKIDRLIRQAEDTLRVEVPNAARLLEESAGYLMMPRVRKAGLGFGGAYGEGALIVASRNLSFLPLHVGHSQRRFAT